MMVKKETLLRELESIHWIDQCIEKQCTVISKSNTIDPTNPSNLDSVTIKFSKKINEELYMIEQFDKMAAQKNHDDLLDYHDIEIDDLTDDDMNTEFDEILISDSVDIFDKNKINITIDKYQAMTSFPNMLLLDNFVADTKHTNQISPESVIDIDKPLSAKNNEKNIWQILDEIDNFSDAVDAIAATSNLDKKLKCKGCGLEGTLKEDSQSVVCSNCGIINDELLDLGPEWKSYNNDDSRGETNGRCGCPSNFFFPKSSQGTIVVGANSFRLKRKQKWNTMNYKEKSLNIVFEYIGQVCTKNKIPKIIIDSARILYKNLSDCKHKTGKNIGKSVITRGPKRMGIIAACVFKACKMNKTPRSIKEIATYFNLEDRQVTRGVKNFTKIIANSNNNNLFAEQFNTDTTEDFIRRHCPKLCISKEDTEIAIRISNNCNKMKLASNHNPESIAAGSILIMCNYFNYNISKKDIAVLFGTSDMTITKFYNSVNPYVDVLVSDEATDHIIAKFKING